MDVYVHDCRGGAIQGPFSEEHGKNYAASLNEFVARNTSPGNLFLGSVAEIKGPFVLHPDDKRRYHK